MFVMGTVVIALESTVSASGDCCVGAGTVIVPGASVPVLGTVSTPGLCCDAGDCCVGVGDCCISVGTVVSVGDCCQCQGLLYL